MVSLGKKETQNCKKKKDRKWMKKEEEKCTCQPCATHPQAICFTTSRALHWLACHYILLTVCVCVFIHTNHSVCVCAFKCLIECDVLIRVLLWAGVYSWILAWVCACLCLWLCWSCVYIWDLSGHNYTGALRFLSWMLVGGGWRSEWKNKG